MPEGPELFLAAKYVNDVCRNKKFNRIEKSAVSKNELIEWKKNDGGFTISAVSRGKEMALKLLPAEENVQPLYIFFHFGMSGNFRVSTMDDIPKHSHLRFYSVDENDDDKRVLNFVDTRRFGRWTSKTSLEWDPERGPCPFTEYEEFRENVLRAVEDDNIFQKPLCEVLLEQKYFNGIGNYLRAEIMFRSKFAPFSKAYDCLHVLKNDSHQSPPTADILQLCKAVPEEYIALEITPYTDADKFFDWCQCYMKKGMNSRPDRNGRTVWFAGPAGPLASSSGSKKKRGKSKSKRRNKAEHDDVEFAKKKRESEDVNAENVQKTDQNNGTKKSAVKRIKKEMTLVEYATEQSVASRTRSKLP